MSGPPPEALPEDAVLVVGAGLGGLAAARALRASGRPVVVLDKSRGVGGRCATRRVDGQVLDHGAPFVHGRDRAFRALVESVPAPRIDGWPARVVGEGAPCHPATFRPGGFRAAFPTGMTALPKHLARGLDRRQPQHVEGLGLAPGRLTATARGGEAWSARSVVLALPVEQAVALLETLGPLPALSAARKVLSWFASEPGLAVAAGYGPEAPPPDFDLLLPARHPALQQVVHDSAKRPEAAGTTLVLHASPAWARVHLEGDPAHWSAELLGHAAALLGDWAGQPLWTSTQRWRYARVPAGLGLSGPLRVALPGGATLVLTGEAFDPDGGLEGAWRAGRRAADLLSDPTPPDSP